LPALSFNHARNAEKRTAQFSGVCSATVRECPGVFVFQAQAWSALLHRARQALHQPLSSPGCRTVAAQGCPHLHLYRQAVRACTGSQ